ncbi:MAG TPA: alpha/beta hydrolase [Candidatus Dormibacteraeota bacterium]|jgi:pimeloyl-ACP methyl ester carboxylesterase
MRHHEARLHDGTTIPLHVAGRGPDVLLAVRTDPYDEATAASMRAWGADPDLGPTLVRRLSGAFRVIAADYEGHRMASPAPSTLTPENVAADLLAIADAAGADRFAWYGYSWLALAGLQLALRTDRLWALAMGGFPPLDGPYEPMLAVTRAAHAMAAAGGGVPASDAAQVEPGDWDSVTVQTSEDQTRQFVTLYEALQRFDDAAALPALAIPRLCFAGSEDRIEYGPSWGGTTVRIAEPLVSRRADLERAGWDVEVLPGLDHLGAMRAEAVLPLLGGWLPRQRAGVTRAE